MPREVRIVSISPKMKGRERHIEMSVRVQDVEDGFLFVQTLEARPEFADVKVPTYDQGRDNEVEFNLTMRYLAGDPKPVATPAPAADTSARLAQSGGAR